MGDLLELAKRCEQASGPERELDGAIWCAVNGYDFLGWDGAGVMWRKRGHDRSHYPADRVRIFTASLDAALTLVPEGWPWSLDATQRPPYRECGRADIFAPGGGLKPTDVMDVYAATPALAICAAALRARAAKDTPDAPR